MLVTFNSSSFLTLYFLNELAIFPGYAKQTVISRNIFNTAFNCH